MDTSKKAGLGQSISSLFAVADKINEFGKKFVKSSHSTGAKAWKFNTDSALANVMAYVADEVGSIDEDQPAEGEITLRLDIEFFRHDDTPQNGEQAEDAVIKYADALGFAVKLDGYGSGEFGQIRCYILFAK